MKKRVCLILLVLAMLALTACTKDINNLTEKETQFLTDTKSSVEKFVGCTDDELSLNKELENIRLSLSVYKKDDLFDMMLVSKISQGTMTQEEVNEYKNKFGSKLKYTVEFSLIETETGNSMAFTVYSFETQKIAKQAYDELDFLRTINGKESSLIKNEIIWINISGDMSYNKQEINQALTELRNAL